HHHEHTLLAYEQVASQFTPNEQEVIQRFLTALVGEIK
ncbi:zinc-dependent transcriptional regulator AdcR, partial [Streptococcus parasanguinis]|nr:zinc-dependent transcriptional regulator AdcR [Streptococcus parasanguinis]